MNLTVERIDRIPVEVPLRDVPARNMAVEIPHWRYFEIVEVELASGHVGRGETMLFYSWGETTDDDVELARGRNAAEIMWDDALGPGLQIALFDAVGRALSVPVHALLGEQHHERTPLSWWCTPMPPEDWAAEAREAVDQGYTNLKVKGRPWFDIRAQLDALDRAIPEWFSVDVDFNGTLLDPERGLPLLEELVSYPQVSHVEGPIPQEDVAGNARLTEALDVPVALHYGRPAPRTAICEHVCDGFVLTDGASGLRDAAAVAAMAERPFWLQLVGTGITAAFAVQCGGAFEAATWPGITCHQLFEHDLLVESIAVEDGYAAVPDEPGLGVEVDMDAVASFRIEKPSERPNPPRLVECDWPDGPTIYLAEDDEVVNFVMQYAREGKMPYFERGATTRLVPDDGSDAWRELHDRAARAPVVEDEPVL